MPWIKAAGQGLKQVTKLGIVASPTTPHETAVTIPRTLDFELRAPTVLQFVSQGEQDVITTISNFDNGDSGDFESDAQVIFDGTMRLKTSYSEPMVDEGVLGEGKYFSAVIDKTAFKAIEKIEVN